MKNFIRMFIFVLFTTISYSQTVNTGDAALDESFNTLIEQVKDNPVKFITDNMALRFNQPKDTLVNLLKKDKLTVADIFSISFLAADSKRELLTVIAEFKAKKSLKAFLEANNILKGTKEYKKFLKASRNVHPKPFIPKVK